MAQPFPFTLANLPAGNNPVSDIDANFAVCVRGPPTTVNGVIPYWDGVAGVSQAAGYTTNPAFGTITVLVGLNGSNQLPAVSGALLTNIPAGVVRTYLSGLTLSNDSGTPNTILDIAAGTCADSTNAVMITLGAFTKTTGGSWTAGTGNAGMGVGLTIANTTWYHVFAIINTGVADVYFDTSVSAANAPVGTTAFRRIGSFLTDGSAHIVAFVQNGGRFSWTTSPAVFSATNPGTSAVLAALPVPLGVVTTAVINVVLVTASNDLACLVSDPAVSDQVPSRTAAPLNNIAGVNSGETQGSQMMIPTNVASQVRYRFSASGASDVIRIATLGWIDNRGM